jgi:hypothetical protein
MCFIYLITGAITGAELGGAQVHFPWPPMDQMEQLKVKTTSLLCQGHC